MVRFLAPVAALALVATPAFAETQTKTVTQKTVTAPKAHHVKHVKTTVKTEKKSS